MKISQLITCAVALTAASFAILYSYQQNVTMSMLIRARGESDQAGLRKEVVQAKSESLAAISAREEAGKKQNKAKKDMDTARKAFEKARSDNYQAKKDWLAKRDELVEVEKSLAKAKKAHDSFFEFLRSLPDMGTVNDAKDAVENLTSVINNEKEKEKTLSASLEEKKTLLTAALAKVATERAERDRWEEINNTFFQNYCKNEEEFVIINVKPDWRVVEFYAGENSGLVAGDSTPLIVRRGNKSVVALRIVSVRDGIVTAEYRAEDLPKGVRLRKGDIVIRQKPVGD